MPKKKLLSRALYDCMTGATSARVFDGDDQRPCLSCVPGVSKLRKTGPGAMTEKWSFPRIAANYRKFVPTKRLPKGGRETAVCNQDHATATSSRGDSGMCQCLSKKAACGWIR